jgi:hypothetical protein
MTPGLVTHDTDAFTRNRAAARKASMLAMNLRKKITTKAT